ncbi:MAG: ABC transporter ATP-binding protein, partial [Rhodospirillaceae bacterium]|nr:ABC transporter ATP-binding protein [Rhodospirillaceae bacterium]
MSNPAPETAGERKEINSWATIRRGLALMTPRERRKALILSALIGIVELIQLAAIATILPVVSVLVQPDVLEQGGKATELYEWLGSPSRDGFLITLSSVAFVALLVGHLGMMVINIVMERYIARLNVRMTHDLLSAIVAAPFSWFLHQNATALTRIVHNDVIYWNRDMIGNGLRILAMLMTLVTTVALVVVLTPVGGLAMLVIAGVLAGISTGAVKNRLIYWNLRSREAAERSMVMANQILTGIKDVKVNRTQDHFVDLFTESNAGTRHASASSLIYAQIPAAVIMLIMQSGVLLVMIALWSSGVEGGALAAQMALIVLASARITPAIIRLQTAATKMINTLPWVAGKIALLENVRGLEQDERSRGSGRIVPRDWSTIAFREVGFVYDGTDRTALTEVALEIARGECLGVKGESGAGKSTFIDLLLGMLRPTSGRVLVGGEPLDEAGHDWLHHVGYVPQQPYSTDDTVAANIHLGLARDDARLLRAIEQAGLQSLIDDLPQGVDTPLGDRGQRASGGQRQRI